MKDDEMRNLCIPDLQDDGYIFLWVTGRAMELGRECLLQWGYEMLLKYIALIVTDINVLMKLYG